MYIYIYIYAYIYIYIINSNTNHNHQTNHHDTNNSMNNNTSSSGARGLTDGESLPPKMGSFSGSFRIAKVRSGPWPMHFAHNIEQGATPASGSPVSLAAAAAKERMQEGTSRPLATLVV